eukprot:CAMPEP_0174363828 /NCGR_PEP_ID=MMETSP0811_2-20130205/70395_1 /TAXON_ID=73025 ORGANISM="Eutreptiella gymnastica-like, Strain CCMP1594" /NCGR_SAMPLE_ID=MMETSP0811_2 /ASSEMBLY_ACC=CAM_ASM_000667 /LENGTH=134 /DNA_ID=CAMNT_0015502877 /DNA_START=50 /DNA_END=450 /DNA_ORIENTATION=+
MFTNGPQNSTNEPRSNNGSPMSQYGTKTGPLINTGRTRAKVQMVPERSKWFLQDPPLRKRKEFTSASKTQPTLPVGPHAMQGRRVHGHGHYPMDLSHACKSVNQNSHYFYPSTWMVSPGVEERKEIINTTVGPS